MDNTSAQQLDSIISGNSGGGLPVTDPRMAQQPMGQVDGGEDKAQVRQKIRDFLKQFPPEQIIYFAQLDPREAIDMLIEALTNEGMPEEESTLLAQTIYAEILTMAQVLTNKSVEEIAPSGEQSPQGQPMQLSVTPPMGGGNGEPIIQP